MVFGTTEDFHPEINQSIAVSWQPPQHTSTCFLHSFWGRLWLKSWFKQTLCYKKIKGPWIYNESKRVLAQTLQLKLFGFSFPLLWMEAAHGSCFCWTHASFVIVMYAMLGSKVKAEGLSEKIFFTYSFIQMVHNSVGKVPVIPLHMEWHENIPHRENHMWKAWKHENLCSGGKERVYFL